MSFPVHSHPPTAAEPRQEAPLATRPVAASGPSGSARQRERRAALVSQAVGHSPSSAGAHDNPHGPATLSDRPPVTARRSYPARAASWRSSVRVISFVL